MKWVSTEQAPTCYIVAVEWWSCRCRIQDEDISFVVGGKGPSENKGRRGNGKGEGKGVDRKVVVD